jgi:hypothetical protein
MAMLAKAVQQEQLRWSLTGVTQPTKQRTHCKIKLFFAPSKNDIVSPFLSQSTEMRISPVILSKTVQKEPTS